MRKTMIAAAVVVATLTGLTGVAAADPAPMSLPGPTGPFPVGTKELHLVDHDRVDPWTGEPREMMVSLWYPSARDGRRTRQFSPGVAAYYDDLVGPGKADFAGTTTHARTGATPLPGRRPAILYSPGAMQSRFLGTTLVEELASRGYLVVGMDHTPIAPVQFPDRVELPKAGLDAARVLAERVRDTSFVLDKLGLSEVGMFGHSMGGFTTADAMIADPRIKAGINLDGSMDPRYGNAARAGVTRPFLLMGGGTSSGKPRNHRYNDDWAAFWTASTGWKRDVYFPAAEHMSFTDTQVMLPQVPGDHTSMIGTIDPCGSLAAQRKYVSAFFDLHLRGRPTTVFDRAAHPVVELIP
ncbi:alpha/beta hydrolase family protein [Amycolatopsis japonica]|uniref:alpha/beta hydrolase family protein n=1 Tax=Amycolatopsis japonica TaxID=208439 RepID=UPI0038023541